MKGVAVGQSYSHLSVLERNAMDAAQAAALGAAKPVATRGRELSVPKLVPWAPSGPRDSTKPLAGLASD